MSEDTFGQLERDVGGIQTFVLSPEEERIYSEWWAWVLFWFDVFAIPFPWKVWVAGRGRARLFGYYERGGPGDE